MISELHAAQSNPETLQNITSFATIGIMMIVFYFMMIRPQRQRQQAHQKVIDSVSIGDEVTTSSGVIGKISQLDSQYIVVNIDGKSSMMMQRSAIVAILPNGTISKRISQ